MGGSAADLRLRKTIEMEFINTSTVVSLAFLIAVATSFSALAFALGQFKGSRTIESDQTEITGTTIANRAFAGNSEGSSARVSISVMASTCG